MPISQSCMPNMKSTQFELILLIAIVSAFTLFDMGFDVPLNLIVLIFHYLCHLLVNLPSVKMTLDYKALPRHLSE